jgi:hypothetical protein
MRYFQVASISALAVLLQASPVAPTGNHAPVATREVAATSDDATVTPGTPRAWALLTCSVLFERNGARHDLLGGVTIDAKSVEEARKLLADWWGIENAGQLEHQLEWLEHEGHRKDFAKDFAAIGKLSDSAFEQRLAAKDVDEDERLRLKAIRKHSPRVKTWKAGLLGWDYSRYVALCRWGHAAGFASEEDAWKRMNKVIVLLQKSYKSWDELGEVYCIGRDCWNPGPNAETWKAYESLRTQESSPWRTTPWDVKLTALEKPPKESKKP